MRWRWPPWRADKDTSGEAQAAMVELENRDAEVRRLQRQLREAQSRNSFSVMVNEAIARAQGGHRR